jgi:histone H3/H4
LRQIRHFQKRIGLCIPRAPFSRLVREMAMERAARGMTEVGTRFSASALGAIHEAAEHALLQIMQMSNLSAIHAKRVTLMAQDIKFVRRVFGVHDPSVWFATDWHGAHDTPK